MVEEKHNIDPCIAMDIVIRVSEVVLRKRVRVRRDALCKPFV